MLQLLAVILLRYWVAKVLSDILSPLQLGDHIQHQLSPAVCVGMYGVAARAKLLIVSLAQCVAITAAAVARSRASFFCHFDYLQFFGLMVSVTFLAYPKKKHAIAYAARLALVVLCITSRRKAFSAHPGGQPVRYRAVEAVVGKNAHSGSPVAAVS